MLHKANEQSSRLYTFPQEMQWPGEKLKDETLKTSNFNTTCRDALTSEEATAPRSLHQKILSPTC